MTTVPRVLATDAALDLIARLKTKHGPLMFHQSGGCCDGSSPMCYPEGELLVGDGDVRLGEIGGCPFYMSAAQFEYWKHTQLTIDVVPGRAGCFPGRPGRFALPDALPAVHGPGTGGVGCEE